MSKKLSVLILLITLSLATLVLYKRSNRLVGNTDAISNQVAQTLKTNNILVPKYLSTISIDYLRTLEFEPQEFVIEEELSDGSNYKRYIASYMSDGNKVYGLLTIPVEDEPPEDGYKAIIFNHGYIPPDQYKTTEKYVAYVDYLARNNFVVFKNDFRGHGESEGIATGTYFSPAYTIDTLNALEALKSLEEVNPNKIGMWGHSMSGNLTVRSMEVSDEIRAGVIWAGAVYSYEDFGEYGLNDTSYTGRRNPPPKDDNEESEESDESDDPNTQNFRGRIQNEYVTKLREASNTIDYTEPFWKSISLTQNLEYLSGPIQLHHAVNDSVVNIGYSRDLAKALDENEIKNELYEYEGGGHNINDPYFSTAMQRTVEFFNENL